MSSSPPSPRRAALAFIFVTAVLDVMAMGLVIPVLPTLIEGFAGSTERAGTLNGLFVALWALMQFVASPIIGSLSDQYGRRPVILLSTAGLAADYVLMALAPSLWWLAVGRVITGITSASFTTAFAYMADVTPPAERSRAYGLIGAAFSGGFVAGPLLGGVLGELDPRAPFWAAGALSTVAFAYGTFVLPESLAPEKRMPFAWRRANPLGALSLLRTDAVLSRLSVVTFLLYFAHHLFSSVFVLYASHRYQWGAWQVGTLLALVGVLDMGVQALVVGRLVKRFGDSAVMVAGLFAGSVGIAAMGLAPTGWLFVASMLPNALWGLSMPTLQALMTSHVSESEQGQLQGATSSVASIAGIVSPLFFGAVYGMSAGEHPRLPHPGTAFFLAALVLLAAAFLALHGARRARS